MKLAASVAEVIIGVHAFSDYHSAFVSLHFLKAAPKADPKKIVNRRHFHRYFSIPFSVDRVPVYELTDAEPAVNLLNTTLYK